jgi:ubiquinol-cytochrome c reductase cytochrome b subunit
MLKKIASWVEERTGWIGLAEEELHKRLPTGTGWPFGLGSALIFLLIVMFVTGFTLATVYAPTPDHAYDSIQHLENEVPLGRIVRGIHHWSASAVVVVALLHLLRTLVYGSYKKPREVTWMLGVLLFLLILGFSFTGYLLPWDQKAYWATVVGTKIAGSVPFIGSALMKVMRGSAEVGALTLSRFYSIHVMLLPWLLIGVTALHLYLVTKHGSSGPWYAYRGPKRGPNPFYPNQIFKDMVIASGLCLFILFMAIKYGAPVEAVANPASSDYLPRPEWYFLSLYQLLKYLPGPLEVVGTVIIPGVLGIALFFLPLLDRNPERSPAKRPWVIGITTLVVLGMIVLTVISYVTAPASVAVQNPPPGQAPVTMAQADPVKGKKLYDQFGCAGCHTIRGAGGQVGPNLSKVGASRTADFLHKKITNPKFNNPSSIMPPMQAPAKDLDDLIAYLQSLK